MISVSQVILFVVVLFATLVSSEVAAKRSFFVEPSRQHLDEPNSRVEKRRLLRTEYSSDANTARNTDEGDASDFSTMAELKCPYSPLPETLDTHSCLLDRDTCHLQGVYRSNFTEMSSLMSFSLTKRSAVRLYVAPHDVDIDLWLYRASDMVHELAHSSLLIGTPEALAITLDPGSYTFEFVYASWWSDRWSGGGGAGTGAASGTVSGAATPVDCHAFALELAVAPSAQLATWSAGASSGSGSAGDCTARYPELATDLSRVVQVNSALYHYNSAVNGSAHTYQVPVGPGVQPRGKISFLNHWNVTVGGHSAAAATYFIAAELGVDFLTGGSLGLVLSSDTESDGPPDVTKCSADSFGEGVLPPAPAPPPADGPHMTAPPVPSPNFCVLASGRLLNHKALKALVAPGSYVLWLFDRVGERDTQLSVPNCAPFTLDLRVEPTVMQESFVTCAAPPLPDHLGLEPGSASSAGSSSGWLSSDGELHYVASPFVPWPKNNHSIAFRVDQPSLLQVRVGDHRIDIDVELQLAPAAADQTALVGSYRFSGPESLSYELAAHVDYVLVIEFLGQFAPGIVCETFDLEVVIGPASRASRVDCAAGNQAPVTTDEPKFGDSLARGLAGPNPQFELSRGPQVYQTTFYTPSSVQSVYPHDLWSVEFTVPNGTTAAGGAAGVILEFQVWYDPLLGPMTPWLSPKSVFSTRHYGQYADDHARLVAVLEPGQYRLGLRSDLRVPAPTGSSSPPTTASGFPACARYELALTVRPAFNDAPTAASVASGCYQYPSLPGTLLGAAGPSSVSALADAAHVAGQFQLPQALNSLASDARIYFQVAVPSFIRAFVAENRVDIDLSLLANVTANDPGSAWSTTTLDQSVSMDSEETVMGVLHPGWNYALHVDFFDWTSNTGGGASSEDSGCPTFRFELAIEPIESKQQQVGCLGADHLPARLPIATSSGSLPSQPAFARADYWFSQGGESRPRGVRSRMPFTVDQPVLLRAQLDYEFLRNDLALRLFRTGDHSGQLDLSPSPAPPQPAGPSPAPVPTFWWQVTPAPTPVVSGPSGHGSSGTRLATGVNTAANRNDLGPVLLLPGQYALEVYEPAALEAAALQGCARFRLTVGSQSAVGSGGSGGAFALSPGADPELLTCYETQLPAVLDPAGWISPLAGHTLHLAARAVADLSKRQTVVRFSMPGPFLFRLYVPDHETLDVDVRLRAAPPSSGHTPAALATAVGLADETLLYRPESGGDYQIEFVFYRRYGVALAGVESGRRSCVVFPFELAIVPVAEAVVPPFSVACPASSQTPWPTSLHGDGSTFVHTHGWAPGTLKDHSFTVDVTSEAALLVLDTRYDFATSAVAVYVDGMLPTAGGTRHTRLHARYTPGRAHFEGLLLRGNWTVSVSDPADAHSGDGAAQLTAAGVQCQTVTMTSRLVVDGVRPGDALACAQLVDWPATAFGPESVPFGGPQDSASGAVRLFGDQFALPALDCHDDPANSEACDRYLQFVVKRDSFVRFFVAAGPDDDIDLFVYSDTNLTNILVMSTEVQHSESAVVALPAKPTPYVLDVYFFRLSTGQANAPGQGDRCRSFRFEMALEERSTVLSQLLCPVPLPNMADRLPPSHALLDRSLELGGGDNYLLAVVDENGMSSASNDTVIVHSSGNVHRIRLTVPDGFTARVAATVGFNFLTNGFRLELSRPGLLARPLAVSSSTGADDRSTYVNFRSELEYQLAAGEYDLDIKERGSTLAGELGTMICHRFSFALTATVDRVGPPTPVGVPTPAPAPSSATVVHVYPESDSAFNPLVDLWVTVVFSEPVDQTLWDGLTGGLLAWNRQASSSNGAAVYLQPLAGGPGGSPTGTPLLPSTMELRSLGSRLTVTFAAAQSATANGGASRLTAATAYRLVVDASRFRTVASADGSRPAVPFAQFAGSRVYQTEGCSCNGQGQCSIDGQHFVCQCAEDRGYTGSQCAECLPGWHGVGTACVRDPTCDELGGDAGLCAGHGRCVVEAGRASCRCHKGFASSGTNLCSVCAQGYTGYPQCERTAVALDRAERCQAPLLPSSLDHVGALGYDGSVHLSDEYFVDTDVGAHHIEFTVKEESVFRLFVEPHRLDIDIWLWSMRADDPHAEDQFIDAGVGVGGEETIFLVLQPKRYRLSFQYYEGNMFYGGFGDDDLGGGWFSTNSRASGSADTTTAQAACETFAMQLAIEPTSRAQPALQSVCGAVGSERIPGDMGGLAPADPSRNLGPTLVIDKSKPTTAAHYEATELYLAQDDTFDREAPRYAYSVIIDVQSVPQGKVARLEAQVESQFLLGQVALLLEPGLYEGQCRVHQAPGGSDPSSGLFGSSYYGSYYYDYGSGYDFAQPSSGDGEIDPSSPSWPDTFRRRKRAAQTVFQESLEGAMSMADAVSHAREAAGPAVWKRAARAAAGAAAWDTSGGSSKGATGQCVAAQSFRDVSRLERTLQPGAQYTLTVYEPRPQLPTRIGGSRCAPFDMRLTVRFEDAPNEQLSCTGAEWPPSLNAPAYFGVNDESQGFVHLRDTFVLATHPMRFTVTRASHLRVAAGRGSNVLLSLRDVTGAGGQHAGTAVTSRTTGWRDAPTMLAADLVANHQYELSASHLAWLFGSDCSLADIELAIEPVHAQVTPSCPSGAVTPYLGTGDDVAVPVHFDSGSKTFAATSLTGARTTVAAYSFTVRSTELGFQLVTAVTSDFVAHALRVALYRSATAGAPRILHGMGVNTWRYNRNELALSLDLAGHYTVEIQRPDPTRNDRPADYECVPYQFSLHVADADDSTGRAPGDGSGPVPSPGLGGFGYAEDDDDDQGCDDLAALATGAASLPHTLDGPQFLALGERSSIHLHSDRWLLPTGSSRRINFTSPAEGKSLLRLYVEPHAVDIDVELWRGSGDSAVKVTEGENNFNDEESLSAALDPGVSYYVVLVMYRWTTADRDLLCAPFAFELAIRPLTTPPVVQCARGGADAWPEFLGAGSTTAGTPQLPLPLSYDSRDPTGDGSAAPHALFYQQQAGSPRSHEWRFAVAQSAAVMFEAAFDFALGALGLRLFRDRDEADGFYSTAHRDRAVLRVASLQPGTYTLRVYELAEQSQPNEVLGCVNYTFRAVAEPVDAREGSRLAIPLPTGKQFTKGVAYLGGSSRLHMSGTYSLPEGASGTIDQFQVAGEALLRVRPAAGAGLSVTLRDAAAGSNNAGSQPVLASVGGSDQTVTGGDGPADSLVYRLQANHPYSLRIEATWAVLFGGLIIGGQVGTAQAVADLELGLEPVTALMAENGAHANRLCPVCATHPQSGCLAEPRLDSKNRYQSHQTLHASHADLVKGNVLQSVSLCPTTRSVVYVHVDFVFLPEPLTVVLRKPGGPAADEAASVQFHRNAAELHAIVEPLDACYTLEVRLRTPYSLAPGLEALIPTCAPYDVAVVMQSASDAALYVDCSALDTLPPSLPVDPDTGFLFSYQDSLLLGAALGGTATDEDLDDVTSLTVVAQPTVLAVLSLAPESVSTRHVLGKPRAGTGGGGAPDASGQAPNYAMKTGWGQALSVFLVNTPGQYLLELSHKVDGYGEALPCPRLKLLVQQTSVATLQNDLLCSVEAGAPEAPLDRTLTVDAGGLGYLHVRTKLTPESMEKAANGTDLFDASVQFTTSESWSVVRASIAFSPLVSGLQLALIRADDAKALAEIRAGQLPSWSRGFGRLVANPVYGDTTAAYSLEATVGAGQWQLHVVQEKQSHSWTMGLPFDVDTAHTLCMPVILDMLVAPTGGDAPADQYVAAVEPSGGDHLRPGAPLILVVRFADAPYGSDGVKIVPVSPDAAGNHAALYSSFYLVDTVAASGNPAEQPQPLVPDHVQVQPSGRAWTLVFSLPASSSGDVFALRMHGGQLFADAAGATPLSLPQQPIYEVTDTQCSGRGTFKDQSDQCACDTGYAGRLCELCDDDYEPDRSGSGACVAVTGGSCRRDSCGCLPGTAGQDCKPLGQCDSSPTGLQCTCNPGLDPAFKCSKCLPSYQGFPSCVECPGGECSPTPSPTWPPGVPTPPPTPSQVIPGPSPQQPSGPGSANSSGAVAGVLVTLALVAAAAAGFVYWRRKRSVGYSKFSLESGGGGRSESKPLKLEDHPMLDEDESGL